MEMRVERSAGIFISFMLPRQIDQPPRLTYPYPAWLKQRNEDVLCLAKHFYLSGEEETFNITKQRALTRLGEGFDLGWTPPPFPEYTGTSAKPPVVLAGKL
jgi:hypothetical protein